MKKHLTYYAFGYIAFAISAALAWAAICYEGGRPAFAVMSVWMGLASVMSFFGMYCAK